MNWPVDSGMYGGISSKPADPVAAQQPVFRPLRKPGPPVAPAGAAAMYYTVTTIGANGRLADSSPLKKLGWGPNQAVSIEVVDEVIVVTESSEGPYSVTSQHHLHLPAEVRRSYRIQSGDRLLAVAAPEHRLLVLYPPTSMHLILHRQHPHLWTRRNP
ncbi:MULTISPECIES: hypothetical protein [Nocardia]|uniref:hypothetical protein n=1 Tax=Nocardia TaxID=1817 RepID=UPI0002F8945D|nr:MULTISPECIES: hypothetical protein [Nocardia]